ncbi:tellurite resistance TerB family protein [Roseitranquillus sediminis]|uniref:tellurite resistance TerB family protein n=1 Tax=Roseitranquillus sediminis TaxID=2809051 RepID=UPI001D0C996B|nr:DUF533 domain-containing protein [Roseitranquillus sediminis]MBM9593588.1 tellurite resistance TerB family protein [Roseitranquillus sediminis]
MSLKRILGTMLATRMAGRGRRRGSMGTAAMLGGLGYRRRPRMGGKMGLAALGYMAYRAYQDHQSKTGGSTGSTRRSSSGGGIAGMVQDVADRLGGSMDANNRGTGAMPGAGEEDLREDERAADSFSDQTALLLIRAMITAAYSDGAMSTDERQRIMQEIDEAGADEEDRGVMEREMANPKPLDELLAEIHDEETAEEFYLTSRAAVDGETEANRAYLSELRRRLNLSEQQVAEVEELAS